MAAGEPGGWPAFEKDPLELTVDDVYKISYDVGCQFREVNASRSSRAVSELRFKILRVLEMLEALVSKGPVTLEELEFERDYLKEEAERLVRAIQDRAIDTEQENGGAAKSITSVEDPNSPRFTFQELRDVLEERNNLKARLLTTRAAIQGYKSGIPIQHEVEAEDRPGP
ncbi:RILP-like protein 2 [Hypanus sabinus]|uniref:RILP-like protein 2 n=1 Tax=Hypanus sabinus TaxID=79690 RepID=UPI0028C3D3CD|nr:RILP-like protein 2 [Hypanus sabinus]